MPIENPYYPPLNVPQSYSVLLILQFAILDIVDAAIYIQTLSVSVRVHLMSGPQFVIAVLDLHFDPHPLKSRPFPKFHFSLFTRY